MEEKTAIIGILVVMLVATSFYFVAGPGSTGMQVSQSYIACCCNILATDGAGQIFVRSQVQTFAGDCEEACQRYEAQGHVFPEQGYCRY